MNALMRHGLHRYAWLSIAAALVTIALKGAAWWVTGSVGLLSDAMESFVNLAAALMMLAMLVVAARPPDEEHAYGYSKAEYFASGFEGSLIFVAAAAIGVAAFDRLLAPQPLQAVGLGLAISVAAALVNLGAALVLARAGRHYQSIALEADARHLLTDVWTTAGVVVGVLLVAATGWHRLDPLFALVVAIYILWAGFGLVRRSFLGLMDRALPPADRRALEVLLERYSEQGVRYHALRTRQAAGRSFVSMHVLVPGAWTVQRGHELLECIEAEVREAVPGASVLSHLEPREDPASLADLELYR